MLILDWPYFEVSLTVNCFLVHIIDAIISIDLVLVLLIRMSNLANLVIVVNEIAESFQVYREDYVLGQVIRQTSKHGCDE